MSYQSIEQEPFSSVRTSGSGHHRLIPKSQNISAMVSDHSQKEKCMKNCVAGLHPPASVNAETPERTDEFMADVLAGRRLL